MSEDQRLYSLADASRKLGLPRGSVQQLIRDGELNTFEGLVRLDDLRACFPDNALKVTGIMARLERCKENAARGVTQQRVPEVEMRHRLERVCQENTELQAELEQARLVADARGQIIDELQDRLIHMKAGCEKQQAEMLGTLLSWLAQQAAKHPYGR